MSLYIASVPIFWGSSCMGRRSSWVRSRYAAALYRTPRESRSSEASRRDRRREPRTSGLPPERRLLVDRHHLLPARQLRRGSLGHPGALEELRVLRAPEVHGVGKDEVAEVIRRDGAFLHQLIRLRQRVAHVDHVEVADVRAVERVE